MRSSWTVLGWISHLLLVPVAACVAPDPVPPVIVTDSAGVRIITASGTDRVLDHAVVLLRDLSVPDSGLTALPWGIAADPAAGLVYVADGMSGRVVVFDSDGNYVNEFGRKGEGPGEFTSLNALAIDPFGAIHAWDVGGGIVSTWSTRGLLMNEKRAPLRYWGPGFSIGSTGTTYAVTNDVAGLTSTLRLVAHSGGERARPIDEMTSEMTLAELPCGTMPLNRVFAPMMVWTAKGDTVYHVSSSDYRIDVTIGGRIEQSLRRAVPAISTDQELAVAAVERGPGPFERIMERCGISSVQLARALGRESDAPQILNLALDLSGRLWVARTANGVDLSHLDVFGPDRRYLGSVEVTIEETGFPVAFLDDSTAVSVRRSPFGAIQPGLLRIAAPRTTVGSDSVPPGLAVAKPGHGVLGPGREGVLRSDLIRSSAE